MHDDKTTMVKTRHIYKSLYLKKYVRKSSVSYTFFISLIDRNTD